MSPERAVFDRISPAIGWRTPTDVIATTLPHCCSCMAGIASLHIAMAARQLSSNATRYCERFVLANVPGGGPPAVGHEDVDAAKRVARFTHEGGRTLLGRDVGDQRHRQRADQLGCRLNALPRAAADGHRDAFARERGRSGEAEPSGGRRHRGTPTRDSEVHDPLPDRQTWMGPAVSRSDCA